MNKPLVFTVVFCLAVGGTAAFAAPENGLNGGVQKNTLKNISSFFDKADANHDDILIREEAEKIPALSSQFNSMDINQDGKVTHQEMIVSIKMKSRHRSRKAEDYAKSMALK